MSKSSNKNNTTSTNSKNSDSLNNQLKHHDAELKRANRALTVISQTNRALLRATDESIFLNEVCEIITQTPGYLLAWIGFAVHDEEKNVKAVAHAGFKVGYLEKIKVHWGDDPLGCGLTGTAIKTGKIQISNNILENPAYAPWYDFGKEHGFNSVIVLPFAFHEKNAGTLNIYSSEFDAFDKNEVDLLSQLASDIEFGLDVIRLRNELVENNMKLKRYSEELEQFVYISSHDLQEPLRSISSYLQLLELKYKDKLDKQADDYINFAVSGAKRLQEMIYDLRFYSSIGSKSEDFNDINLNDVLDAVVKYLDPKMKASNAVVTYDKLPVIKANADQIYQLFLCLIDNGIKFHREEPPRIHVKAEKKNNEWQFSVSDNGMGIDQQYFPNLFNIFKRLVGKDVPGNGIGLPMSKKIVEHHHGEIWVESTLGKGSTFYFTIPT